MTEKKNNGSESQTGRIILWSVVLIGGAAIWAWGLYAEGDLDLSWLGLGEQVAVEEPKKKSSKSSKPTKEKPTKKRLAENKSGAETVTTALPQKESPIEGAENTEQIIDSKVSADDKPKSPSPEETELTAQQPAIAEKLAESQNADEPNDSDAPSLSEKNEPATSTAEEAVAATDAQANEPSPLEELTNKTLGTNGAKGEPLTRKLNAPVPAKVIRYATKLLALYDIDRSTRLEPIEYNRLANAASLLLADENGDEFITLNELSQYMANYGHNRRIRLLNPYETELEENTTTPVEKPSKSTVPSKTDSEEVKTPEQLEQERRNGLKYSVKKTRVPAGTPGWFFTKDQDGDVQLSLSEYAPNASQKLVDEFRKYDLNQDGLVTPQEYLSASKIANKKKTPVK